MVELALRFGVGLGDPVLADADPRIEYLPKPGTYRRFGNRVEINADGLRAPAMRDGAARLLVLGDSVIYGNHFLDQADTVAYRMTGPLQGQPALAPCGADVLPIAASSWGPVNQAAYLARFGSFNAQAAVIVVSAHDLFDVPRHDGRMTPYRRAPSWSATGDGLQAVWERLAPRVWPGTPDAPPETRAADTLSALDQILGRFRADGVHTALVYHPTLPEWTDGVHPAATRFADWAARRGVPFRNLRAMMGPPPEGSYRDTIHPAPTGAAALADALLETLKPVALRCPAYRENMENGG
jgi:hypothetical protein